MYFSLDMLGSFSIGGWLQFSIEQEAKAVSSVKKKSGFTYTEVTMSRVIEGLMSYISLNTK